MSTLPLYTMNEELLESILARYDVDNEQKQKIKKYAQSQKKRIITILENETIEDEIPDISSDEFEKNPPSLQLSGVFCEKDLSYTETEYAAHLSQTKAFAKQNANYLLKLGTFQTFHNLQILIHEEQWAMVSKGKAPAIHFVIRHPKLRNAIENFIPPIIESE